MQRMIKKVPRDWLLLLSSLCLYAINRFWLKDAISMPVLGYFLRCHFNDLMGGVSFVALVNIILASSVYRHIRVRSVWTAMAVMFMTGLLWEYVIPRLNARGTADPWDILAYMAGGAICALLSSTK